MGAATCNMCKSDDTEGVVLTKKRRPKKVTFKLSKTIRNAKDFFIRPEDLVNQ